MLTCYALFSYSKAFVKCMVFSVTGFGVLENYLIVICAYELITPIISCCLEISDSFLEGVFWAAHMRNQWKVGDGSRMSVSFSEIFGKQVGARLCVGWTVVG